MHGHPDHCPCVARAQPSAAQASQAPCLLKHRPYTPPLLSPAQELRALDGEMAELRAAKGEKEGQLRELKQRMAAVDEGIKKAASRWGAIRA